MTASCPATGAPHRGDGFGLCLHCGTPLPVRRRRTLRAWLLRLLGRTP